MTADPFAGRFLVGPLHLRRAADQADLSTVSYTDGASLPYRAFPRRKPAGTPDPAPVASLEGGARRSRRLRPAPATV